MGEALHLREAAPVPGRARRQTPPRRRSCCSRRELRPSCRCGRSARLTRCRSTTSRAFKRLSDRSEALQLSKSAGQHGRSGHWTGRGRWCATNLRRGRRRRSAHTERCDRGYSAAGYQDGLGEQVCPATLQGPGYLRCLLGPGRHCVNQGGWVADQAHHHRWIWRWRWPVGSAWVP